MTRRNRALLYQVSVTRTITSLVGNVTQDMFNAQQGSPRIWHGQSLPFTISKDSGQVFVDQNSGRLATSPLLPLIIAVHHYAPVFPMGKMDFITDRNSIRKLYRWVVQSAWGNNITSEIFRIDVELVGKTILLQRWEVQSTQRSGPGYEKNFQKCMTSATEGTSTATGHHRIVAFVSFLTNTYR